MKNRSVERYAGIRISSSGSIAIVGNAAATNRADDFDGKSRARSTRAAKNSCKKLHAWRTPGPNDIRSEM